MKIAPLDLSLKGWVLVLSIFLIGGTASAAAQIRIAVAPFAGESSAGNPSAATLLATHLSSRDLDRLITPADFIADPVYEPRASEVRRWAFASAVDTIVVGRVVSQEQGDAGALIVIDTVVRSGHSGAEVSRHQIIVSRPRDLDGRMEELASEILDQLGYREGPATQKPVANGDASASGGGASTGIESDSGGGGALGVAFSESNFKSDAPIEIKADEAEIINRDAGRKLIFQHNVWVRQDNVTLRSDRLEATYRKGESEPRELVAEGHVQIVQNDRRAKCDRAVYLREENRLTCHGRAELIQGCDMIRGASIEFDLAGEQARVEGAASILIESNNKGSTACTTNRGQL
jgi:lipopolysaccharide transport protein LptA